MGYCFSESGSAGVVSSAPNPWRGSGENLGNDMAGKGREILVGLRDIIRNWPREKTAILRSEHRHHRFIMAVAGYPDIDVATRPFDSPLHKRSTEALKISQMLDNVVGMDKHTSLRSSLLNRDLNLRLSKNSVEPKEYLEELERTQKECLLLLLARLRQLDEEEVSQPNYRPEEEGLLAALHGYDNSRRVSWWPSLSHITNMNNGDFSCIIGQAESPGKRPDREKEPDRFQEWKEKNDATVRERSLERLGIAKRFSFPDSQNHIPMTFQFHYVQRWLREYFPEQENMDGTAQRFLRGTSIMLELIVSEARHRIVREVGIGSITADGGGRVSFLCPRGKMEDRMRGLLEEATWQFLLVMNREEEGSAASNNIRFESTINRWAEACIAAGHGLSSAMTVSKLEEKLRDRGLKVNGNKSDLIKRLGWSRKDAEEWFKQTQSKLPAFSVTITQGGEDENADPHSKLNQRMKNGFPKVVKGKSKLNPQKDCMFCRDLEGDADLDNIDELMGVNDSLADVSKNICPTHRLLYFLGFDQRLKDSVLRAPPQEGSSEHRIGVGGQRQVNAVARIDGNSLGIIFADRHENDFDGERVQDRRRRRSFRFNAHWWGSLRSAVDLTGTGDLIAAWVTAGDDVILAEYGPQSKKEEVYEFMTVAQLKDVLRELGLPVSGKKAELIRRLKRGWRLRETLEIWAEGLETFDEELDEDMGLSFGAGLAVKRPSVDRITPQLRRSEHYEKIAKNRWKTMMEGRVDPKETHPMLTRLEGDGPVEIDWSRDTKWQHCILGNTDSVVVEEEGEPLHVPEDRESVHAWELEWTEELIREIAEKNNLSSNERERWEVLKRHYIEENGEERVLKVLIPPVRMLVPVGGSRANIISACQIKGVTEIHFLLTNSLFPKADDSTPDKIRDFLIDIGVKSTFGISFIKGPEAGAAGCRDDILRWSKQDKPNYIPERIFVTASTNLIIATLCHLFPSSDLVSLRYSSGGAGADILLNSKFLSKVDQVDVSSYLAVHDMELKGKKLFLGGKKLPARIDTVVMRGPKAVITFCAPNNHGSTLKKETRKIGSTIKSITDSCGRKSFGFNAFGFQKFINTAVDLRLVNTIPGLSDYQSRGISKDWEVVLVPSHVDVNTGRCYFRISECFDGVIVDKRIAMGGKKYSLLATGEIDSKGRMKMKIDESRLAASTSGTPKGKVRGSSYSLGEENPEFMNDLKKIKRDSKSNEEGG